MLSDISALFIMTFQDNEHVYIKIIIQRNIEGLPLALMNNSILINV